MKQINERWGFSKERQSFSKERQGYSKERFYIKQKAKRGYFIFFLLKPRLRLYS